jgi:predicted RNA binding protein YcfA (HicA-like mRNA interferase family)
MNSGDLIRKLKKAGWQLVRVSGSHHTFKHPAVAAIVTVPHPRKDLGKGLVRQIERVSGVSLSKG